MQNQLYCLPVINSWGWGIWKNRWKNIDFDDKNLSLILEKKFNLNNNYFYSNILFLNKYVNSNSWAIFAYCYLYKMKLRTIFPPHSLVSNTGFDGSGENCNNTRLEKSILSNKKIIYEFYEINRAEIKDLYLKYRLLYASKLKFFLQKTFFLLIKILKIVKFI
jgi:hypothetical protein